MARRKKDKTMDLIITGLAVGGGIVGGRYVNSIGFVGGNPQIAGAVKIAAGIALNTFLDAGKVAGNVGLGMVAAGAIDLVDSTIGLPAPGVAGVRALPNFSKLHRVAGRSKVASMSQQTAYV